MKDRTRRLRVIRLVAALLLVAFVVGLLWTTGVAFLLPKPRIRVAS